MVEPVFAFGSNMCLARLQQYGVANPQRGIAALLRGHRLRFNKRSNDGSGKANVEVCAGHEVWGVLYYLQPEELALLDSCEVGYARCRWSVTPVGGTAVDAWMYVAPANDDAAPYDWYKRFLVEGAKYHQLPSDYVSLLEGVASIQDPDPVRAERRRQIRCDGAG